MEPSFVPFDQAGGLTGSKAQLFGVLSDFCRGSRRIAVPVTYCLEQTPGELTAFAAPRFGARHPVDRLLEHEPRATLAADLDAVSALELAYGSYASLNRVFEGPVWLRSSVGFRDAREVTEAGLNYSLRFDPGAEPVRSVVELYAGVVRPYSLWYSQCLIRSGYAGCSILASELVDVDVFVTARGAAEGVALEFDRVGAPRPWVGTVAHAPGEFRSHAADLDEIVRTLLRWLAWEGIEVEAVLAKSGRLYLTQARRAVRSATWAVPPFSPDEEFDTVVDLRGVVDGGAGAAPPDADGRTLVVMDGGGPALHRAVRDVVRRAAPAAVLLTGLPTLSNHLLLALAEVYSTRILATVGRLEIRRNGGARMRLQVEPSGTVVLHG